MRNYGESKMSPVSEDGEAFLKTATAAPDYESLPLQGIPDGHSGPTVCLKQYVSTTVTAKAGTATYLICTPQGDVSYWETAVPTGTDWINGQDIRPTLYPQSKNIFPTVNFSPSPGDAGSNTSGQISKGRLISTAAELEVLNNSLNQYGSITVWKVPLQTEMVNQKAGSIENYGLLINGLAGCTSKVVGSQAYTCAVREGAYSVSMNREDEFDFHPIRDGENLTSVHDSYFSESTGVSPGVRARFNGPLALWDNNFDTIVFRIDVPTDVVDQSFLFKRWVNFEAQPVFNSLLWNTSHLSPTKDEAALALYRELVRALPVAVPRKDNPDFWRLMLNAIDEASNILSYVPGPIGNVAKGVHGLVGILDHRKKSRTGKMTGKPRKSRRKKKKGGG